MGYREISGKHLRFCGGPVNSLWSNMSSSVTAQNILISRVSIQEHYLLSHSGISPLATIRTFWFNELNPKGLSWRPHFVQLWCGHAICWRQMMKRQKIKMMKRSTCANTTKHCGCQRNALWLKSNRDFSSVKIMNCCFARCAAIITINLCYYYLLSFTGTASTQTASPQWKTLKSTL